MTTLQERLLKVINESWFKSTGADRKERFKDVSQAISDYILTNVGLDEEKVLDILHKVFPPYELELHPNKTYTEQEAIALQCRIRKEQLAKAICSAKDVVKIGGGK